MQPDKVDMGTLLDAVAPRTRHSALYLAMHAGYDAMARAFAKGRPDWPALVAEFTRRGLVDGDGKPPSVRCAQQTYYRVKAAKRARRMAVPRQQGLPLAGPQAATAPGVARVGPAGGAGTGEARVGPAGGAGTGEAPARRTFRTAALKGGAPDRAPELFAEVSPVATQSLDGGTDVDAVLAAFAGRAPGAKGFRRTRSEG